MGKYIYRKKTVNDPVEFLSAFKNGYPYAYLEYSKEMEQPLYRYLFDMHQADQDALYCIICMIQEGRGCAKNTETAFKLFFQLANTNYVLAQYELGKCYKNGVGILKDPYAAAAWLRRAAEQGEARAQYELAKIYAADSFISASPETIADLYKKSATQGIAEAQFELGACYEKGVGVEKE